MAPNSMGPLVCSIVPIETVVRLAAQYPVFPCRRAPEELIVRGVPKLFKEKTPLVPHGLDDATQDPDQIRAWWGRWPEALVAVVTGSATRLVVVDYDIHKADAAAEEWIGAHSNELLATRVHGTLSGGRHYFYRTPQGHEYRNGVCLTLDGLARRGIDVRAERGYIIWWPAHGGSSLGEIASLPAGLIDEQRIETKDLAPLPTITPSQWATDRATLIQVLPYLDPADHGTWMRAGMSIHLASGGSDEGFALWHSWSSGEITGECPPNYSGINDCRYSWGTYNKQARDRKNTVTIASLVASAKEKGFVRQSQSVRQTPQSTIQEPASVDVEGLNEVSNLNDLEYDLVREKTAAGMGIRVTTLDKLRRSHQKRREKSAALATAASSPQSSVSPSPEGFTDTDLSNGVRLAKRHGKNLRYTAAADWMVWKKCRWWIDEKNLAAQFLAKETAKSIYDEIRDASDRAAMFKHAKYSESRKGIDGMLYMAKSEPGIPAILTDFDTDPLLLNMQNGTLDLRTGDLRTHQREDLITKLVPIDYDPNAEFERWDRFLTEVTAGDLELIGYLRRLVGYLLTGLTNEHALHFLFGLGANGKSVFCEIIAALLGEYAAICSPELIMLKRHQGIPNDIARLRGIRAAFMNETAEGARFDEAKLKDLTGSDSLTGRFLHREFFDFVPTHKLLIRGNHKPAINGTDEGIWRRLHLVPFTVSITPEQQDRELLTKLKTELPGILRWALSGCLEWQREGLKTPSVILDAVREYREESDTLGQFLADQCEIRPNSQVAARAFFQRYQQFCERTSERWMSAKDLPHEMQRRGFESTRKTAGMVYLGIELKLQNHEKIWFQDDE